MAIDLGLITTALATGAHRPQPDDLRTGGR
jgi:hypothetical protein